MYRSAIKIWDLWVGESPACVNCLSSVCVFERWNISYSRPVAGNKKTRIIEWGVCFVNVGFVQLFTLGLSFPTLLTRLYTMQASDLGTRKVLEYMAVLCSQDLSVIWFMEWHWFFGPCKKNMFWGTKGMSTVTFSAFCEGFASLALCFKQVQRL